MNILVLGSKGQLGTALSKLFLKENIKFKGFDLPEFNIIDKNVLTSTSEKIKPDIIINACAFTDVYRAETEFDKAMEINGISLKYLVYLCNIKDIFLCHISTDYVFDGYKTKPYLEEDTTNPINCYGLTKDVGEKIIQNYCQHYAIVRTAALYGDNKNRTENIVDKIITSARSNKSISLVEDEFTSPTYTNDLAYQIYLIIKNDLQGIIHSTSEGKCNWVEFGKYIFQLLKLNVEIENVKSRNFSKSLKKPLYSVLENTRLKTSKINFMPHWKQSIKKYLIDKKYIF
ncbi:MAG: dTDP-4-dehydrorhamnose reductase [Armatimonadetes bacterium]|nr:dTDP-4-dehydrorhamnose reductase [Armatimonadota bacterium]